MFDAPILKWIVGGSTKYQAEEHIFKQSLTV
jgi:hypothetical protein